MAADPAATTSTSCCATSPRWAPVSRAPREELGEDSDQGQGRAKTPHRLVRPAGRDQAGRLQPPLPPSLQVRREVSAGELGPAEVRGQHERLPHEPGQHDRRPQGLHAQAAAGALPADGLATPSCSCARRRALRLKDGPGPGGRDGELPGLLPGAVGARPHPLRHAARGRLGRHAAALGPHSPHHRRAGLQGRAGLRHGRAELHLQPRGARQLDLVLGLQRHVPGRNDTAHAQQ